MRSFIYLLYNLCIFVPTAVIAHKTGYQTFKNWRAIGAAVFVVSIPFVIWDVWAAANGHWFFSDLYILPARFAGIPYEEILFFITIPIAMCFIWDVIIKKVPNHDISEVYGALATCLIALAAAALLFTQWGKGYSVSVSIAALVTIVVIVVSRWWRRNVFWWFQLASFGLFFICNTFLTALPVITYGADSFSGLRIGTIPLEDFFFNFALINLFVLTYDYVTRKLNP